MKHVTFCADDYGQNQAISQAILELLRKNRLSATSCLVTFPHWPEHAKEIKPFQSSADIGLHFNLTEGKLLTLESQPLFQLLKKAFLGRLNPLFIEKELHAQIDCYLKEVGQLPHFLDGHQHVHHFPVIRDVVLKVYEERLREKNAYLRCVHDPYALWRLNFKKMIIELSGAYVFKKLLVKQGIPHNQSFAGVYDFASDYSAIFPGFLKQIQEGGLIMCHPGLQSQDVTDPIAEGRFREYQFFTGSEFDHLCEKYHIIINRLKVS